MDVRLVKVDQEMAVMLRAREQILKPLNESLPPRRIGAAEPLLRLLPREVEQSGADRLATTGNAEALARPGA